MLKTELKTMEKHILLRFLYQVIIADFKKKEEGLELLKKAASVLGLEITFNDDWLDLNWEENELIQLQELVAKNANVISFLIKWSELIMDSDNIRHSNEQKVILDLIMDSIGNPKYANSQLLLSKNLTDLQKEMLKVTPLICHKKATHWQKTKPGSPIKRVAASISYINKAGEEEFVTTVNYELSTPGGSRCAEQNAIGMIIAQFPEIKKEAIRDVFIYGGEGLSNPCKPCGVCTENLSKVNVKKQINLYLYPNDYVYAVDDIPKEIFKIPFHLHENR